MGREYIKKRMVAMCLSVLMLFAMMGTAFAGENTNNNQQAVLTKPSQFYKSSETPMDGTSVAPRYNRILKLEGSIDIDANKNVGNFTASVTAQSGKATSTHVKAVIQRKIGSTWRDYKTYNYTGDDWRAYWIGNQIPLADGYTYRLKVTGTVYYNNVSETDTLYTAQQTA